MLPVRFNESSSAPTMNPPRRTIACSRYRTYHDISGTEIRTYASAESQTYCSIQFTTS